ncbi:MAG: hypothetical protein EAX90_14935 [Candidatus Heimdallarchaeota archaeon]|nr:hypothetical protein [Candidatus Heimdallarchaeota archaeon]
MNSLGSSQQQKNKNRKEAKNPKKEIFRSDTAGKLFTLVSSPKIPCVYRFWATLKDYVNIIDLQQALDNIIERFPYYHVIIKRGFRWFHWQKTDKKIRVTHDREYPCQYIPLREPNTIPIRVMVNKNQIIIEFNHSLTDGTGALIFLKALLGEYYNIQGLQIDDWEGIFRPNQQSDPSETEYAHRKYYERGIPKIESVFPAFHLPHQRINNGIFRVINGKMSVEEVLLVSKKYNVTLTEYLAAIYIEVLQEILLSLPPKKQKRLKRPIRILVPINIRNLLPSKTMWNFTAFVAPGIDPRLGKYSFEEIIDQVHHYKNMQMNKKFIVQQISDYVRIERNPFISWIPRFIKRWFVGTIYKNIGESMFSAIMTNLGITSMPIPLNDEIFDLHVLPMNHPYFKTGCALLTYKGDLNINFGRNIQDSIVEEKFFSKLKKDGINVIVTEIN